MGANEREKLTRERDACTRERERERERTGTSTRVSAFAREKRVREGTRENESE